MAHTIGALATAFIMLDARVNPHLTKARVNRFDDAYERDFFEVDQMNMKGMRISFQHEKDSIICVADHTEGLSVNDLQMDISREHIPATHWNGLTNSMHAGRPLSDYATLTGMDFDPVITGHHVTKVLGEEILHLSYDIDELAWSDVRADLLMIDAKHAYRGVGAYIE